VLTSNTINETFENTTKMNNRKAFYFISPSLFSFTSLTELTLRGGRDGKEMCVYAMMMP
jgi:hypothetical protein